MTQTEKFFLIKAAVVADNVGNWVGGHVNGGRGALSHIAGAVAGGAADAFVPGAMTVDSYADAGHNFANMGSELGAGHYGSAAWNGLKGLWNGGLGTLALEPIGGPEVSKSLQMGAKGIGWLGKGLKGLAGFGGKTLGAATEFGSRGIGGAMGKFMPRAGGALAEAGASIAGKTGPWAENAASQIGSSALGMSRRFQNTGVGRTMSRPAVQWGGSGVQLAPNAYNYFKSRGNIPSGWSGGEGERDEMSSFNPYMHDPMGARPMSASPFADMPNGMLNGAFNAIGRN